MPKKGIKDAGTDSLPTLDTSAETSEKDLKEGERRKSGELSE